MKRFIFCLLLIACSSSTESKTPEPQDPTPPPRAPDIALQQPAPIYKVCEIVRVDETHGCTIYTLTCDDGSSEYYLTCRDQPMGVITNPPDPVLYQWESKTKQE